MPSIVANADGMGCSHGYFDSINVGSNDSQYGQYYEIVSQGSLGQASVDNAGALTYQSYSGPGTDYVTYRVWDDWDPVGATAQVTINVTNAAPVGVADAFSTKHDTPLDLSFDDLTTNDLDNDPVDQWGGLTVASVGNATNGTVVLNPVTGTITFTPDADFVGQASFTYIVRDLPGATSTATTVAINVWNATPGFATFAEYDTGEEDVNSAGDIFGNNMILGQLQADDFDGDNLTFSGASSYLDVLSNGLIRVIDGPGLTAFFEAGGSEIEMPVSVTDGLVSVNSLFTLKKGGWAPSQSHLYVKDSTGFEYYPSTASELTSVLIQIRNNSRTVTEMIIKGHADGGGIGVGTGDDFLTAPDNGNSIYLGDNDVTQLLNDVTDSGTTIYLRGCFSYGIAKQVRAKLDGAQVYGAIRFVIGIPGTSWGIGVYQ